MKKIVIVCTMISGFGLSACNITAGQQAALTTAEQIACRVGKTTLRKEGMSVKQCTALGGAAIAVAATAPATTP